MVTAARGTPGKQQQPGLPPETQGVTSGQMFAALANVGNLADIYPDSQTEPARQEPALEPHTVLPEQASADNQSPGHAQVRQQAPTLSIYSPFTVINHGCHKRL